MSYSGRIAGIDSPPPLYQQAAAGRNTLLVRGFAPGVFEKGAKFNYSTFTYTSSLTVTLWLLSLTLYPSPLALIQPVEPFQPILYHSSYTACLSCLSNDPI